MTAYQWAQSIADYLNLIKWGAIFALIAGVFATVDLVILLFIFNRTSQIRMHALMAERNTAQMLNNGFYLPAPQRYN